MIICIDSCVFIQGLQQHHPVTKLLFQRIIPTTMLVVPRVVVREVTRNLKRNTLIHDFYELFQEPKTALIVDEPVPAELVNKYVEMGLNQKGDAIIGAFAEWQQVDVLISNNRHFLRSLQPTMFTIADAATFVARWQEAHGQPL